jgi:hypothetical protein
MGPDDMNLGPITISVRHWHDNRANDEHGSYLTRPKLGQARSPTVPTLKL